MSISSAVKFTGVGVQIRSSTPDTVVDGLLWFFFWGGGGVFS